MRAVAILAMHNEERFIEACLQNLFAQGMEAYLIDNESTDRTVEIAERHLGRGVVAIESFPRSEGTYKWRPLLARKEEIAETLDADWFMHADPDEIRLPPRSDMTLVDFFAEADDAGHNAVNFLEFTFLPTREHPDHDTPDFQRTMRWYYPFLPKFPNRMNAWRKQPGRVNLGIGGHMVRFPGLSMAPESGKMRHYLFLSPGHAREKYVERVYDPEEAAKKSHGWRATMTEAQIRLPPESLMRVYTDDDHLDPSEPWTAHYLDPKSFAADSGTGPTP